MRVSGTDPLLQAERRSGQDRRRRIAQLFLPHRRRHTIGRRSTDKVGYVDVYDRRTWALAISVVVLSFLDALLTILHLDAGHVTEANPLLAYLLDTGGLPVFLAVKAAMTSLPLALIILHKQWRLGRVAARLCLWSYIAITLYHLYLAGVIPDSQAS
jgi:hypothetical protein